MVDKKPLNLVENWERKSKDQFDEKLSNPMRDWGGKLEGQWQCAAHK